jgi:anti-sigma B factor antagonist
MSIDDEPISPAFPLTWESELLDDTDAALVVVRGELDRQTAPALRDHLEWLTAWVRRRIVIDCAGITFADVGAHEALNAIGRLANASGCDIVLHAAGPDLRRLLDLLGAADGVAVDRW